MENEIEIVVRAGTGLGSTTVAEMIDRMFAKEGFDVEFIRAYPAEHSADRDDTFHLRRNAIKVLKRKIVVIEQRKTRSG